MAPGRAEPDFGLQCWIDTLGLKQIFLIYSAPPFSLSRFFLSLPPLSLRLPLATQASIFCKIFSRLNRRAKVWVTGWYSWLSSFRFSVGYFRSSTIWRQEQSWRNHFNILHLYKFILGCEVWGTEEMYYSQVIKIVFKFPALQRHKFEQALSLYFRV